MDRRERIERLLEVTYKDILKDIDPRTLKYSKGYTTDYVGITKDWEVVFQTVSRTTQGKVYTEKVKLLDYPAADAEKGLSTRDKVRLALAGDLAVSCTCPAYLYWGHEYIMTQLDAHNGNPQTIYPHIRNPNLRGTVCKHLKIVLQVLPFYQMTLVSQINKGHFV